MDSLSQYLTTTTTTTPTLGCEEEDSIIPLPTILEHKEYSSNHTYDYHATTSSKLNHLLLPRSPLVPEKLALLLWTILLIVLLGLSSFQSLSTDFHSVPPRSQSIAHVAQQRTSSSRVQASPIEHTDSIFSSSSSSSTHVVEVFPTRTKSQIFSREDLTHSVVTQDESSSLRSHLKNDGSLRQENEQ